MSRRPYAGDMESDQRPLVAAVDLFGLLQGMWRRKLLMLFVLACVVGLAFLYVTKATPKYTARAEVLIENTESAFTRTSLDPQPQPIDERYIASQIQVIIAADLAERLIGELGLVDNPNFQPPAEEPTGIRKWLIEKRILPDPRQMTPERYALEVYYEDLEVYPIKGANVVAIAFTSPDPSLSAEVANTLANLYVKSTREIFSTDTNRASTWLADQIEQLRDKVVASERAVEEYRTQAGLLQGREHKLSNESLTELNNQIIQATAQRAELEARAEATRRMLAKPGAIDTSTEVLNSPLMQRLVERQVSLRGQRDELLAKFLPGHPRIQAIDNELAGLERQMRQEVLKIAASQEQQAEIARAREAALLKSLDQMKAEASTAGIDEVKLRALEREAAANRTMLETFLTRFNEATARESELAQPSMARVISPAIAPVEPSSPKPIPLLALAIIGGIILALVIAFVMEVLSLDIQRARLDESARPAVLGPRALPPVNEPDAGRDAPSAKQGPPLRDLGLATNSAEAAGRAVPVIAAWASTGRKRVLLMPDPATAAAWEALAETARGLSRAGQRVIIVDMNPTSDDALRPYGVGTGPGLAELLEGKASFSEAIRSDSRSQAHILRGGDARQRIVERAGQGRLAFVLNALTQAYDLVLLAAGSAPQDTVDALKLDAALILNSTLSDASRPALLGALDRLGASDIAWLDFRHEPRPADSAAA